MTNDVAPAQRCTVKSRLLTRLAKLSILFLLFAVVFVLWTQLRLSVRNHLLSPGADIVREGGTVRFSPRVTFSAISEWASDVNGDGVFEEKGIEIRNGRPEGGRAIWRDEDGDGSIEHVEAELRPNENVRLCMSFDFSKPTSPIVTVFSAGDMSWEHRDIDRDGVVDTSLKYLNAGGEKTLVSASVLCNSSLLPVDTAKPFDDDTCWALVGNRGLMRLVFDGKRWTTSP